MIRSRFDHELHPVAEHVAERSVPVRTLLGPGALRRGRPGAGVVAQERPGPGQVVVLVAQGHQAVMAVEVPPGRVLPEGGQPAVRQRR